MCYSLDPVDLARGILESTTTKAKLTTNIMLKIAQESGKESIKWGKQSTEGHPTLNLVSWEFLVAPVCLYAFNSLDHGDKASPYKSQNLNIQPITKSSISSIRIIFFLSASSPWSCSVSAADIYTQA